MYSSCSTGGSGSAGSTRIPPYMPCEMWSGTSPKAQWYMNIPGYSRRASMTAVSPGATVVSAAPPPCPVTAWKSTLCGCVLPARFVIVKRRTSPTRARMIGPGVPVTEVSPLMR